MAGNNEMSMGQYRTMQRVAKLFSRLHVPVYRASGGRLWGKFGGREICLVTMIGAKSGKRRTIPLMYVPYKGGIVLVASLGGAPRNPVWYNNLVAHPEVEFQHRSTRCKVRARLADDAEREAVWPLCVQHYPPYADYAARTARKIPVFICEPVG